MRTLGNLSSLLRPIFDFIMKKKKKGLERERETFWRFHERNWAAVMGLGPPSKVSRCCCGCPSSAPITKTRDEEKRSDFQPNVFSLAY